MGRASTGAKSGLVAGLIWGIISAVFTVIALIAVKQEIINALNTYLSGNTLGLTADSVYNVLLITAPVIDVITGLIGGLILGAIYGWGVNRIPGKNDKIKGMVFGIILWLIFSVALNLGSITEYGLAYYLFTITGGFIGAIVYGYILGTFFGKWWKEPGQDIPVVEPQ